MKFEKLDFSKATTFLPFLDFREVRKIQKAGWRQNSIQELSPNEKESSRKINAEGDDESIRIEKTHVFISKSNVFHKHPGKSEFDEDTSGGDEGTSGFDKRTSPDEKVQSKRAS